MPATIIVTIPKTRWCRCTPLSLTTLPGHQGTLGLRISRVLMRMKAKEPMKPTSTRKSPCSSCWTRLAQKSEKIEAVIMRGPAPSLAAARRRP